MFGVRNGDRSSPGTRIPVRRSAGDFRLTDMVVRIGDGQVGSDTHLPFPANTFCDTLGLTTTRIRYTACPSLVYSTEIVPFAVTASSDDTLAHE